MRWRAAALQVIAAADRAAAEFAETHRLRQAHAVLRGSMTWARRADAALLAARHDALRTVWRSLQGAAAPATAAS